MIFHFHSHKNDPKTNSIYRIETITVTHDSEIYLIIRFWKHWKHDLIKSFSVNTYAQIAYQVPFEWLRAKQKWNKSVDNDVANSFAN